MIEHVWVSRWGARWWILAASFLLLLISQAAWPAAEASPQPVEIRDYQGEKLGSVNDFRENSISGVQHVDPQTYRLVVDGLVAQPVALALRELQSMPHTAKLVTLYCVEGWSVEALWEGIRVGDLLTLAQPNAEANTIIFHAADGYTTSLSVQEVVEKGLVLADRINGIALPEKSGFPFELVAEDKWGYKWIKWVTRIELSNDPTYRGFWETRGYNNKGDLSGSMFGRTEDTTPSPPGSE